MKIRLFHELLALSEKFGPGILGLERMEQPICCPSRAYPLSKWKWRRQRCEPRCGWGFPLRFSAVLDVASAELDSFGPQRFATDESQRLEPHHQLTSNDDRVHLPKASKISSNHSSGGFCAAKSAMTFRLFLMPGGTRTRINYERHSVPSGSQRTCGDLSTQLKGRSD
jgi:hypothetical protein